MLDGIALWLLRGNVVDVHVVLTRLVDLCCKVAPEDVPKVAGQRISEFLRKADHVSDRV